METHELQKEVANLHLLNPQQREIVETDIASLEQALYGRPMRYTGGDPLAQGYVPGDGEMSVESDSFMGRTPPPLPEPELVRHNLAMDRLTLEKGTAKDYSGHRKNLLYKLYKEEVERYKEGLLSEKQL